MTYNPGGGEGSGWYSENQIISGHTLFWKMVCNPVNSKLEITEYCDGLPNSTNGITPLSCSPFDSGPIAIPGSGVCCSTSIIVEVTQ